jgi:hypothetical protein
MKTGAPEHILRNRRNKIAKGMTNTLYRDGHGGRMSDDALTLSVRGTTDRLRGGLMFYSKRMPCACCGCKCRGKLALNDAGQRRLTLLRRIPSRAEKKEAPK